MAKNKPLMDKFDLSSVQSLFSGAAPLGAETADALQAQHPSWKIKQGYGKPPRSPLFTRSQSKLLFAGLTETSTVVCSSAVHDLWFGSCGSLIPGCEAKLVSIEGKEITGYDQPGELVVKSPSVVIGYLNNPQANKETFQDGWMRTGDEAVVRVGPGGNEHIFIVDRIKELIKVKVRSPPNKDASSF